MRRTEHYGKYQIMAGLIAAAILTGCAGAGGTVSETPAGAETTGQAATMAAEPSSETVTEKTVTEKEEAEAPVPARADTAAEAVAALLPPRILPRRREPRRRARARRRLPPKGPRQSARFGWGIPGRMAWCLPSRET